MNKMTKEEMIDYIVSITHKERGALYITFNPHTGTYESAESYIKDRLSEGRDKDSLSHDCGEFINEQDQQKCIQENTFWEVQWYEKRAGSFLLYFASSLDLALKHLIEIHRQSFCGACGGRC